MTPVEAYEKAIKALNDARQDYNNKLASINNVESSYQEIITMLGIVIANNELLEIQLNDTQKQLDEKLNAFVGSIAPFSTPEAPEGWLECNGQDVDRQRYSELYKRIGDNFGKGDGETTFKLPDLRGQFVRGWDQSGERDFASFQSDQLQTHGHNDAGHTHNSEPHEHSLTTDKTGDHAHKTGSGNRYTGKAATSSEKLISEVLPLSSFRRLETDLTTKGLDFVNYNSQNTGGHSHSGNTNSVISTIKTAYSNITEPTQVSHGAETRPKNIALLYCIKY